MKIGEYCMKDLPVRKNIRLKGYDYSLNGYYFITVCTRNREFVFGTVKNDRMILTEYGTIAERNLMGIPLHLRNVKIDKYIVMPNHVHLILIVDAHVGTRYIASDRNVSDTSGRTASDSEMMSEMRMPNIRMPNIRTPYMASLQVSPQEKSKQIVSKTIQQYKASVSRDTGVRDYGSRNFTTISSATRPNTNAFGHTSTKIRKDGEKTVIMITTQ